MLFHVIPNFPCLHQDTDRSGTIGFNEVSCPFVPLLHQMSHLSLVYWFMEVYQGVCESSISPGRSLTKRDAGLAGRVPSFRSRQIRDDRWPRNAVSTKSIRLQAVPTTSEPCATQIWYG